MKKIFSLIVMALFSAMLFSQVVLTRGGRVLYDVALEDVDSITFVTDVQGEPLETMSPIEQKDKMLSVATEFIEMFKPKDHRDLIELISYFVDKYGSYDWSSVYGHYEDELPFLRQLSRGIRTLLEEDITCNLALEVYDFPRFTGVFEANDEKHTWQYLGESENIEFRFKNVEGELCSITLAGQGESVEFEFEYETDSIVSKVWVEEEGYVDYVLVYANERINYSYPINIIHYDEKGNYLFDKRYATGEVIPAHYEYQWKITNGYYDYVYYMQPNKVVLPSNISFSLKEAGVEHIELDMNIDIEKSSYAKYDMNLRLANITFVNNISVSDKDAFVNIDVKIDDKSLISAKASLPAVVLMGKETEDELWAWLDEYDASIDETPFDRIKTGFVTAEVDIVNQMQIKASSKDIMKFYHELYKLDDLYSEKLGESYSIEYDYIKTFADCYNKNLQIGVYYNTPVQQAELQMDVVVIGVRTYEESEEAATDERAMGVTDVMSKVRKEKVYDSQLVLYFPQNGTTYQFEDYFTQVAFGSLADMIENLVDNYMKLAEYNKIEPIGLTEVDTGYDK